MTHEPALGDTFFDTHSPTLRGSLEQHRASRGAGLSQTIEHAADRTAAAGLIRLPDAVVLAIDRREVDSHLRPVELQLFSEYLREARLGALPHLARVHQQSEIAVSIDTDPAGDDFGNSTVGCAQRHTDIDEQDAACEAGGMQERTSRKLRRHDLDHRPQAAAAEGGDGSIQPVRRTARRTSGRDQGTRAISCTSTMPPVPSSPVVPTAVHAGYGGFM